MCPEVDGIVKTLSIMSEESWQSKEDPTGCKGETEAPFLKRGKRKALTCAQQDDGGDCPGNYAQECVK